jgi:predicted nicotinamide N-methyase
VLVVLLCDLDYGESVHQRVAPQVMQLLYETGELVADSAD